MVLRKPFLQLFQKLGLLITFPILLANKFSLDVSLTYLVILMILEPMFHLDNSESALHKVVKMILHSIVNIVLIYTVFTFTGYTALLPIIGVYGVLILFEFLLNGNLWNSVD